MAVRFYGHIDRMVTKGGPGDGAEILITAAAIGSDFESIKGRMLRHPDGSERASAEPVICTITLGTSPRYVWSVVCTDRVGLCCVETFGTSDAADEHCERYEDDPNWVNRSMEAQDIACWWHQSNREWTGERVEIVQTKLEG